MSSHQRNTKFDKSIKKKKVNRNKQNNKSNVGFSLNGGNDEDISSSDSDTEISKKRDSCIDATTENDNDETVETKRIRLARKYLSSIDVQDEVNESDMDTNIVGNTSELMKINRLKSLGRYFKSIAIATEKWDKNSYNIKIIGTSNMKSFITCLVVSSDDRLCFFGSKDNSLVMVDLLNFQKRFLRSVWKFDNKDQKTAQSSEGDILCLALSSDDRYLVCGGNDKLIRVFDSRQDYNEIHVFSGHRDAVTCLTFQRDCHVLFSGSLDRCVKHWDLQEMAYIETLFGHQDTVLALDCWTSSRPVSCSSDRTTRAWKVEEDSHLVFRGHKQTIECVQILTLDSFVTGGQDGSLCLWKHSQKHPITTIVAAHGKDSSSGQPNWICCLNTIKMTDLLTSGSCDGYIRLWKCNASLKCFIMTNQIPVEGFVVSIHLSSSLMAIGTSKEHRMGRWCSVKGNRNKVVILKFENSLESSLLEECDEIIENDDNDDDEEEEGDDIDDD